MKVDQIIDVANKRTEDRGAKKLNLPWEFYTVLQDFCSRKRWFWRKKRYSFSTVAGQHLYDLSTSGVIAESGGVDIEEIIKNSVFYVRSATDLRSIGTIFDEDLVARAINDTKAGEPESICLAPGSYQSIYVNPVPAGVYTIEFQAWAMPNGEFDSQLGTVPLVPKYMHPGLVKGLEAQILRYTLGEGSAKFAAASAEYEAFIQRFSGREGISGKIREWRDDSGEAVQST